MTHLNSFITLREKLASDVLGQPALLDRLIVAMLSDGHVLVEGPPGLAKTRAIRSLARLVDTDFHRVQFTPDLLPGDLTGTDVFRPQDGSFRFEKGPIFHSVLLADEINRAPAKVQSALLEAMAERQVTIGQASYALPDLFFVMATQNPIEHEGVYPLPEAQLDRFLFNVRIDYPAPADEAAIVALALQEARQSARECIGGSSRACVSPARIHEARQEVLGVYMADPVAEYIVRLVAATRQPEQILENLPGGVDFGASPRASVGLARAARAQAWMQGRNYVTPDDIQVLAPDVLRHRIGLSFRLRAEGWRADSLVERLLAELPVP